MGHHPGLGECVLGGLWLLKVLKVLIGAYFTNEGIAGISDPYTKDRCGCDRHLNGSR